MSVYKTIKKFFKKQKIKNILSTSRIGATTDLVLFNIKRNKSSLDTFDTLKSELMKSSNHIRGGVGERYISLIVNETFHDYLMNAFNKNIISVKKNVACIAVNCSNIDNVSGVITYITSIISENNINMYDFFTSQDDILLVIDENKAYEYVNELKKRLNA